MFGSKRKAKATKIQEQYWNENQQHFEHQMKRITALTDNAMKQAHPGGCTLPVRNTAVIDYDRLLMIWDIAARAKSDTIVR